MRTTPPLILAATDFSEAGNAAAAYAVSLAAPVGARVVLVHVFDGRFMLPRELALPPEESTIAARTARVSATLDELAATLATDSVPIECLAIHGVEREEVPALAKRLAAMLIVLGAHGHGPGGYFLGSVADAITRTSPVPVLIVRGDAPHWSAAKPVETPRSASHLAHTLTEAVAARPAKS
jgi:nucleotide-binding universal stress UspA family protein